MKSKFLAAMATVLLLAGVAKGQLQTNVILSSVNLGIPDGNPVGLASSTTLSGLGNYVTSISVQLDITGGFNGDLYVYLAGPAGGFTVLLNRVGLTASNPFGYSDTGFNITLSDSGTANIHTYQLSGPSYSSGQLTGTWVPDGRNIDPLHSSGAAFDSASTSANLMNAFFASDPNGAWTLYAADLSSGSQATLVSWGLTVVTVPEPQTWLLLAGGVGALLVVNRNRKR